jgi:hypothetical protein
VYCVIRIESNPSGITPIHFCLRCLASNCSVFGFRLILASKGWTRTPHGCKYDVLSPMFKANNWPLLEPAPPLRFSGSFPDTLVSFGAQPKRFLIALKMVESSNQKTVDGHYLDRHHAP